MQDITNVNSFEGNPDKQRRWDDRYIGLAHHIAQWSKDPRAKVGAVIVNPALGRIVATGFNGFPSNVEDSVQRLADKDRKLTMTIHAEQNALLFAGREARQCDAYVIGKPICNVCAMLLIQSGVRRVVAARPKEGTASHWDRVGIEAVAMMREAGVAFVEVTDAQFTAVGLKPAEASSSLAPADLDTLQHSLDFLHPVE